MNCPFWLLIADSLERRKPACHDLKETELLLP
jgi:hypothetical protein